MNKEVIKEYILNFQSRNLPKVVKRDIPLPNSPKIRAIIGARRVGKTYLMYEKMQELESNGVGRRQMIYLNFENPALDDISYREIREIINVHWSLFPDVIDKKLYLFIDEPQVIDRWERAVRGIYDEHDVAIFITGSSSRLLSREVASSLRGRAITTMVLTLSFKEFLRFKGREWKKGLMDSKTRAVIEGCFDEYIKMGAYPEVVSGRLEGEEMRVLQDYLDLTLYRDLVERYHIGSIHTMRILIDAVVGSVGSEFSLHKYYQVLKARGLKIGKATLYEYFGYLLDAFFAFAVKRFSYSLRTEALSLPKVYLGDVGFLNLYGIHRWGGRLENIVYLELLRRTYEKPHWKVNYWKSNNGYEVDFVVSENRKVRYAYQVALSLQGPKTKEREIRALLACMREFDLKEGTIITRHEEGEERVNGREIHILPAWKWLLGI